MPKIAEVKEIEGQVWVRINLHEFDGQVSLYSERDVAVLKRDIALTITDEILKMFPAPST